jgi:hypothetical protein
MKEHIIPIPMYNGTLHLIDCKDTKQALMEINGADYNEEGDNTEACLFWNHEKNSANWWLCINLEDSEIGVLAHELFHATHRILEYFGVEFTSKNHEPFAYLLEYLMNECIKLRKQFKSK